MEHKDPLIAIIVLNFNGKNDTIACLHSLSRVEYPSYRIYVVDNGSSDDSCTAISSLFPEITLIPTGKNLGFAEGNNVGIRRAINEGARALFILNNDTTVKPDILDAFVTAHKENPQAGILGATLYRFDKTDTLDHLGGMWNPTTCNFDLVGLEHTTLPFTSVTPIDYICGAGMYIPVEVLGTIGLFEKNFFLLWEDADLCFRARKAGFLVVTCPDAIVWHKGSASFSGKPQSTYFFWRNRLLFMARHLSKKEKNRLYLRTILPELGRLSKHYLLRRASYALLKLFTRQDLTSRKKYLNRTEAAFRGIKDYFLSRFEV